MNEQADEIKRLSERCEAAKGQVMAGEKRIKEFDAGITAIANTLRDVGHPVVCAGVDTGPNGGHTTETICAAIRSLASVQNNGEKA